MIFNNMFNKIFNRSFNKNTTIFNTLDLKEDLKVGDLVYHKLGYYSEKGVRIRIVELDNLIAKVSIEYLYRDGYSDPLFEEYGIDELDKL